MAVALDLDKPFKPQAAQVRADLADGEKYSEISQDERAKVGAALDRIEAAFQAQPDSRHCSQSNWQRFATIRSSSPEF
ncbi:putative uncharacterized protein [Xanthomonas citri pv. mangiferaeindicae LMG 941]|nr:putative uncharacterized protein [Xanthomonas citri pv. mangiferaeindicae LMG 941]